MFDIQHLNKAAIEKFLPHREIAMTLDGAKYDPSKKDEIIATMELPILGKDRYFEGHYPENPMFPGHWQIECICLAGALLCMILFPSSTGGFPTLTGIGNVDFKRPVKPGEDIEIHAKFLGKEIVRGKEQFRVSGKIFRKGKLASTIDEVRGVLT